MAVKRATGYSVWHFLFRFLGLTGLVVGIVALIVWRYMPDEDLAWQIAAGGGIARAQEESSGEELTPRSGCRLKLIDRLVELTFREQIDAAQEPGRPGVALAGLRLVRMVIETGRPALRVYLGYRISTGDEQLPKRLQIRCARKPAGGADDGDPQVRALTHPDTQEPPTRR